MQRRLKKVLCALIAVTFCGFVFTGCKGCNMSEYERNLQEDGYFQIIEREDSITVVGLTASGAELEVLVIPPYIKGKPVTVIGYNRHTYFDPLDAGILESDTVKKIYLPWTLKGIVQDTMSEIIWRLEETVNSAAIYKDVVSVGGG